MPPTRVRYLMLWLTVPVCMITYMDRAALGATTPSIREELGIDVSGMGLVASVFIFGYTLFQIPSGWLGDRVGPRRALALIVAWSSVFASATAFAESAASLAVFRFLFSLGAAGTLAIVTRSLSRWTLPSERGLAQGLIHSAVLLAVAITPFMYLWPVRLGFRWRAPFFYLHLLGLAWAAVWLLWYRDTPGEHSKVNRAERELIQQGIGLLPARVISFPWRAIFSSGTVWTLSAVYACYGCVFWVYLQWFPTYFLQARVMHRSDAVWFMSVQLASGVLGSLTGGWLSDRIFRRTGNLKMARQSVAIGGLLLVGIVPVWLALDQRLSIVLVCIGFFGLQATKGMSWAATLDIGGDYTGSVAGVMNFAGNIGGAIGPVAVGYLFSAMGWQFPFVMIAILGLVAAALFKRIDTSRPLEFSSAVDRLPTVERVFHEALARPVAERCAFVEEACDGNSEVVREIESLLLHVDQKTAYFDCALQPVASNLLAAARGAHDIRQGAVLGAYRIDFKLGEGGMGAVYAATDTRLGRRVAVKVVSQSLALTPEARAGFLCEARSAAALAHANIAVLHDVGETNEIPWIVMEYVAGLPLRSKLEFGPVTGSEFLKHATQLAAALEHAHARGIIHRDIKPENIIITEDGNLKVIDFGVAMPVRDNPEISSTITNAHRFAGTIAYAAPEVVSGAAASSRSDVYSAGVVMYEMAYGQHPFRGLSGHSLVAAILTDDHRTVRVRTPAPPSGVAALIERCLSCEPAMRYRDGSELAAALCSLRIEGEDEDWIRSTASSA